MSHYGRLLDAIGLLTADELDAELRVVEETIRELEARRAILIQTLVLKRLASP